MRVMIVDDSPVYRTAIYAALKKSDDVEVVKVAQNGEIAVNYLNGQGEVDLITLDMEMPVMDGIATINTIRKFNKTVIIICFSSLTASGAKKTIDALTAGADDFVSKISGGGDIDSSINLISQELIPKILAFKERVTTFKSRASVAKKTQCTNVKRSLMPDMSSPLAIGIGVSTGGPDALKYIFSHLTDNIKIPILLVQHMPPIFTTQLARMLDDTSPIRVVEAEDGMKVINGYCYLAPGDYHMGIKIASDKSKYLKLNQEEKICYVRPSVDALFLSMADVYAGRSLNFVLTGMGEDGLSGARKLVKCGAPVYVQDEESSIVWGMPRAVFDAGISSGTLPLDAIPQFITDVAGGP